MVVHVIHLVGDLQAMDFVDVQAEAQLLILKKRDVLLLHEHVHLKKFLQQLIHVPVQVVDSLIQVIPVLVLQVLILQAGVVVQQYVLRVKQQQ